MPSALAQPTDAGAEIWPYTVERGDTLIGITARLLRPGSSWRELRRINRVADPRRLPPGQTLRIPVAWLLERALAAEVLHAHGTVSVERGGAPAQRLAGGETLVAGDVVVTGELSSAALRFADGSRVLLRPHSRMRLERSVRLGASDAVQTRLRLDAGSADSRVPPVASAAPLQSQPQQRQQRQQRPARLELHNAVANLGVRGTEFRAALQGDALRLEVLEGQVAATTAAATTEVNAGMGTVAQAGRVAAPRPLLGAPDLTTIKPLLERLPVVLEWAPLPGANQYRAQLFAPGERLVLEGLFDRAAARWSDDVPDGNYELRVRAADSAGLEGRSAQIALTLKARPEPPFPTAPRAGAKTADESVNFEWTRNPAAARYRLQLSSNADFSSPLVDRADLVANQVQLPLPLGTLHWRLASIRGSDDMGPWGEAATVTRVAVPPAPSAEPPQLSADGILLRWAARPGASYRIQIARDAAFTQMLHDERSGDALWLLRAPQPGSYYVRTQAIDADGFAGPFGQPQQINVPQSGSLWWWLLVPVLLLLL